MKVAWSRSGDFWKGQHNLAYNHGSTRAQHSIQLVTEKNELLARINNTSDQCTKDSLQTLLENVRTRLPILHRSESSRKRRWKIRKANQEFLKNPYQAGKARLDPKYEIQL